MIKPWQIKSTQEQYGKLTTLQSIDVKIKAR